MDKLPPYQLQVPTKPSPQRREVHPSQWLTSPMLDQPDPSGDSNYRPRDPQLDEGELLRLAEERQARENAILKSRRQEPRNIEPDTPPAGIVTRGGANMTGQIANVIGQAALP